MNLDEDDSLGSQMGNMMHPDEGRNLRDEFTLSLHLTEDPLPASLFLSLGLFFFFFLNSRQPVKIGCTQIVSLISLCLFLLSILWIHDSIYISSF